MMYVGEGRSARDEVMVMVTFTVTDNLLRYSSFRKAPPLAPSVKNSIRMTLLGRERRVSAFMRLCVYEGGLFSVTGFRLVPE